MTDYIVNHAVVSVWDPEVELQDAKSRQRVRRLHKGDVVTEQDLRHADLERLTEGDNPALRKKTDESEQATPVAGMLTSVENMSADQRNSLREQLAEYEDEDDLLGDNGDAGEEEFDPGDFNVDDVNEYLSGEDITDQERARVIAAERAGKNRTSIVDGPYAG